MKYICVIIFFNAINDVPWHHLRRQRYNFYCDYPNKLQYFSFKM